MRPKLKGEVKEDCKVLAGATTSRVMAFTALGRWWEEQLGVYMGGQIRSLILFNLSVRYVLGIKSELLDRQLDIWVYDLGMTSGPEI